MTITNASEAKGRVLYGLHFYPGIAQYEEPGKEAFRVFLNEDTLRAMDPSFAGRPVFVLHVDEVEPRLDELRKEADGWVVESFYNAADGKHWSKFIVVSDKGNQAVDRGLKLSNCYIAKQYGPGGTWNGLSYDKEIVQAEYEHLAIVPNPRYEESIIMTPDEFKSYNEQKILELKKLSNNASTASASPAKDTKSQGETTMKFSFFKRAKVENTADLECMSVLLPKSQKEITLSKLINAADEMAMKEKEKPEDKKKDSGARGGGYMDADASEGDKLRMALPEHHVDVDGEKMPVGELVKRYKDAVSAMKAMKDASDEADADEASEGEEMQDAADKEHQEDPAAKNDDEEQDLEYSKEDPPKSDSEKAGAKEALKLEKEQEAVVKDAKRKNAEEAKKKADAIRNAGPKYDRGQREQKIILGDDMVRRGRQLFGSGK